MCWCSQPREREDRGPHTACRRFPAGGARANAHSGEVPEVTWGAAQWLMVSAWPGLFFTVSVVCGVVAGFLPLPVSFLPFCFGFEPAQVLFIVVGGFRRGRHSTPPACQTPACVRGGRLLGCTFCAAGPAEEQPENRPHNGEEDDDNNPQPLGEGARIGGRADPALLRRDGRRAGARCGRRPRSRSSVDSRMVRCPDPAPGPRSEVHRVRSGGPEGEE